MQGRCGMQGARGSQEVPSREAFQGWTQIKLKVQDNCHSIAAIDLLHLVHTAFLCHEGEADNNDLPHSLMPPNDTRQRL
jgi:hypothetical protein